jgi:hypothetical protein
VKDIHQRTQEPEVLRRYAQLRGALFGPAYGAGMRGKSVLSEKVREEVFSETIDGDGPIFASAARCYDLRRVPLCEFRATGEINDIIHRARAVFHPVNLLVLQCIV